LNLGQSSWVNKPQFGARYEELREHVFKEDNIR